MKGEDDPLRRYRSALTQVACPPPKKAEGFLRLLPILVCAAAGGAPKRAAPVAVAWHLFRLASGLLDHVQDGDPIPSDGTGPQAVSLAAGLLFAGQRALTRLPHYGVSPQRALSIIADFNATALRACAGQYTDLASDRLSLEACRQALSHADHNERRQERGEFVNAGHCMERRRVVQ